MVLLTYALLDPPLTATACRLALPPWKSTVSSDRVSEPVSLVVVHAPGSDPLSNPSLNSTDVPLSPTLCGLPLALSVIVMPAVRAPMAVGLKVTLMVHDDPAASVLGVSGQVLVWANSLALVPVIPILLIVNGAVPLSV